MPEPIVATYNDSGNCLAALDDLLLNHVNNKLVIAGSGAIDRYMAHCIPKNIPCSGFTHMGCRVDHDPTLDAMGGDWSRKMVLVDKDAWFKLTYPEKEPYLKHAPCVQFVE
jgi:hypothetical protein